MQTPHENNYEPHNPATPTPPAPSPDAPPVQAPDDACRCIRDLDPWPEPVDGKVLLDNLREVLGRFIILPKWAAETLALWILHTYAFHLREVSTYIGIESPQKRCGKTTLVNLLRQLVHRPEVAANISSPAFFRVIEESRPTLLMDEADTLLLGNDELRGILNSGYTRDTAYVVRVASPGPGPSASNSHVPAAGPQPASRLARFSCWCPKLIAGIGHLPDTLADRCIVIRMHRKTPNEKCERLRSLAPTALRRQCARFVLDHAQQITSARPAFPVGLNDRAADIWEPLLVLADAAGTHWPDSARNAAVALTVTAEENSPAGMLLFDIFFLMVSSQAQKMFSRDLVAGLNSNPDRPWAVLRRGKAITELWLAQQLRKYDVRPRTMWIGDVAAKGYLLEDFADAFRRYIPRSELESLRESLKSPPPPPPATSTPAPPEPAGPC